MRRLLFSVSALLTVAAALALSGCGSSSSTSSTPTATPTPTQTAAPAGGGGGDFCTQAQNFATQFLQVEHSFLSVTPGATPSVTALQQLVAAVDTVIDSLDSSAPSAIATDVHTLRAAFDQASTQVQAATTFQQISAAFAPLSAPAVKSANDSVTAYLSGTCHITPAPTP